MIGIINFGIGNIGSVSRKFDLMAIKSIISDKPEELARCDKLILPGVGHFSSAVKALKDRGLWNCLNEEVIGKKKPILGICLGMQLMAKHSEEGDADGLSWFDAEAVRFGVSDTLKYKVPHIGWNDAPAAKPSPLLNDIPDEAMFYFVHSYHLKCNNEEDILTTTIYDYRFTSAVQKANMFGVQFHPEKSHDNGEKILRNFVNF